MRNENLNLIISESNRMSEMVNDILDYPQFSAGYSKLKKDWYDLRDIVNAELTPLSSGCRGTWHHTDTGSAGRSAEF